MSINYETDAPVVVVTIYRPDVAPAMRTAAALLALMLAGAAACGGDDSARKEGGRTVTSEFLSTLKNRDSLEASTPGSGGFIETPQQRRRVRDVPPVKQAATGESIFTGILQRTYVDARARCRAMTRA